MGSVPLRIGSKARDDPVSVTAVGRPAIDRVSGQVTQVVSIPDSMAAKRPAVVTEKRSIGAKRKNKEQ
ncbi:hypothetical protein R1flu_024155 [Riccia fluitans]|uniref:Uncharacterized protein n=1 Tax=Riccia fluitans TaxID=41844 RepID=A0ABD1XY49_9MARC